jgi:TonB family protein
VHAAAGWRRPALVDRDCIRNGVRVPRALRGFVSGSVAVKFAVGRDGSPSDFQVLSGAPDPQLCSAVWRAIRNCRWMPGTDPQGRPAKIWVVMPLRFLSG